MFKITKNPTFAHDIAIEVPVDGGFESHMLRTRFRVLALSELAAFEPLDTNDKLFKYIQKIVEGFEDLVDDSDKPLACTDSIKNRLLELPYVHQPIRDAYVEAMTAAKRKN
jgi:hypothetical protein